MPFLLALDQGTTSSRAFVYDEALQVMASAQRPVQQFFPTPGWVEHDPIEIWHSQRTVALEAIANAGLTPREIAAVGITNQRETTVLWNRRTGQPLHRALVWQDRRTAAICDTWRAAGRESLVHTNTGLVIDPYFSASKIQWLLDHCDARAAAARGELAVGTIDSWLIWNLTGGRLHITDASNASRTQLYNLATGTWDETLLALWNVPREILPTICDSSGTLGMVSNCGELVAPIAGVAGDQQAALFGQACFDSSEAKCTYGTGCFILRNIGAHPRLSQQRLLTTVAWSRNGVREFALEGSVFMGGAVVQWLRDGLGIIQDAAEIETLAAQVTDSAGVVLVPAFTGLGAPHWDADARGLLIGMTRGTTRAHVARAALDSITLQVHDILTAMTRDGGAPLRGLKVDGGAANNRLLLQLQANLLNTTLVRPQDLESTARGAASLAGLGLGIWRSHAELRALQRPAVVIEPVADTTRNAALLRQWQAAVSRARGWLRDSA